MTASIDAWASARSLVCLWRYTRAAGRVPCAAGRRQAAPSVVAVVDRVEVLLEDLPLGVGVLDLDREHGLLDLAVDRHLVPGQPDLDQLLGDGRGALHGLLRPPVDQGGPAHGE